MATSSSTNVSLKENSLKHLVPCATFGIFGKRRTGKSVLAAFICKRLSDGGVRKFVVFCGNRENMIEWARVVHPLFIHGKDLERFKEIVQYQDLKVGEDRERFDEIELQKHQDDPSYSMREYRVPNRLRLGVFHDDTGNDRKYMHGALLKDVSSNGRHYGMDIVFLLQYITQLHPDNRDQLDYVMMMQTTNAKSIEKIYSEYVTSTCCEPKIFQYLLAACTNRKGKCMLIDTACGSLILHERIFFVQIPYPVPRVLLGSKQFIAYGKKHYLSAQRQNTSAHTTMKNTQLNKTTSFVESDLSKHLDDGEDDEDEDFAPRNDKRSVVSLNRKSVVHLSTIREGRHSYTDNKGNQVRVHLNMNEK